MLEFIRENISNFTQRKCRLSWVERMNIQDQQDPPNDSSDVPQVDTSLVVVSPRIIRSRPHHDLPSTSPWRGVPCQDPGASNSQSLLHSSASYCYLPPHALATICQYLKMKEKQERPADL
jgi:hypothetical protein